MQFPKMQLACRSRKLNTWEYFLNLITLIDAASKIAKHISNVFWKINKIGPKQNIFHENSDKVKLEETIN